uniref:G_PROTEIN_RECEP_F1_2 domain-containing protein n=1 Tax=Schistosoma curassoni TaxID=6186 RepID=A0A183KZB2_9TREM
LFLWNFPKIQAISFKFFPKSQINFDTDIGKKQELSISHQQSQSNLSKASINPNESFLNMERKSIGDLFSASFTHDSPTNEVQLKQESSDYQHMYSSKTAECKTDTDPPSADDNLIADSLENGVDNDNDRDNIFSVINVTQNYTLWKTFLTELNDHIEGLKSSNQSQLNYIAIQPGWLLNTNSDSNNDNDFRSSSESLCWKSGPAGQPTVGGGKNMCTNYDLYLSGLAISSVLLMKNAVFWIHFLTESG